jgi:hypothetical protein
MALTLRAVPGCGNSIVAIVALKRTIPQVVSKCHIAVGTFEGEAAIRTEDKIGESPSIEKEETLFFVPETLLKRHLDLF